MGWVSKQNGDTVAELYTPAGESEPVLALTKIPELQGDIILGLTHTSGQVFSKRAARGLAFKLLEMTKE